MRSRPEATRRAAGREIGWSSVFALVSVPSSAFALRDPGITVGTAVLQGRPALVNDPVAIDRTRVIAARTEQRCFPVGRAVSGARGGAGHLADAEFRVG